MGGRVWVSAGAGLYEYYLSGKLSSMTAELIVTLSLHRVVSFMYDKNI